MRLIRLSTVALAAGLASALSTQDIPSDTPVSSLLRSAQGHLSRGETNEALVYYDAAVARDPNDYLTFFKRATTYLSLGRASQATEDFNKVLAIKPDFDAAHVQLGKIRQRAADWSGARVHFQSAKNTPDARDLATAVDGAEMAARYAEIAESKGNWEECVNQAGVAIMVATRAPSLRNLRARCRFARAEIEEGLGDLIHVLHLNPGDVTPHLVISAINFYALGDLEKGMAQVRKCLQSDPDSKPCRQLLRQEKAAEKVLAKINKAFSKNQPSTGTKNLLPSGENPGLIEEIKEQEQALREAGTLPAQAPNKLMSRVVGLACQGYYEMNSKKATEWCGKALELDEHSLYGLLNKQKAQVEAELFDAAIATLNKAKEAHPDRADLIDPVLHDVQIKLKRSKTKDYYKVLGVAHDADERQIKSAYRRMAKQHHPDKAVKQGLTKEETEKKMAAINEAYEVLSTPELRARFDQGDDPMSNEQPQHQYHGNPFGGGGGGQPFMFQQGGGGGQQQFKFQFGSGGGFPGGFPFGG